MKKKLPRISLKNGVKYAWVGAMHENSGGWSPRAATLHCACAVNQRPYSLRLKIWKISYNRERHWEGSHSKKKTPACWSTRCFYARVRATGLRLFACICFQHSTNAHKQSGGCTVANGSRTEVLYRFIQIVFFFVPVNIRPAFSLSMMRTITRRHILLALLWRHSLKHWPFHRLLCCSKITPWRINYN